MTRNNIRPGVIVYTCLIQACIRNRRANMFFTLFNEIVKNNIIGDTVFYNTLVNGLVQLNFVKEAVSILIDAYKKNVNVNTEVYEKVLKMLCLKLERKSLLSNISQNEAEIALL